MKPLLFLTPLPALLLTPSAPAAEATFDDVSLTVPPAQNYTDVNGPGRYYNGSDEAGGFTSGGAVFSNSFTDFGSFTAWNGWSVSNTTDLATAGLSNQYSAYNESAGGGHSGNVADRYGIFYESGAVAQTIDFGGPVNLVDAYITNTTYAYKAVVEGDDGFGAVKGPFDAGDYFKVTVWGFDAGGAPTGSLDVYLADYRSADSDDWYALDTWTAFDLSSLGAVHGLGFDLDSTDTGDFGMNTPAYFALDDLGFNPVPIPGAVWLFGSALLGLAGWKRRRRSPLHPSP